MMRVEMGVTQERFVLSVDFPAGHRDLIPLGGPAYPHSFCFFLMVQLDFSL